MTLSTCPLCIPTSKKHFHRWVQTFITDLCLFVTQFPKGYRICCWSIWGRCFPCVWLAVLSRSLVLLKRSFAKDWVHNPTRCFGIINLFAKRCYSTIPQVKQNSRYSLLLTIRNDTLPFDGSVFLTAYNQDMNANSTSWESTGLIVLSLKGGEAGETSTTIAPGAVTSQPAAPLAFVIDNFGSRRRSRSMRT